MKGFGLGLGLGCAAALACGVALAACSSGAPQGGGSSAEESTPNANSNNNVNGPTTVGPDGAVVPVQPENDAGFDVKTNPIEDPTPEEPAPVFCAQENVAFDLSAFVPGDTAQASAWAQSRAAQTQPGLVLMLNNAKTGPVSARLGAVSRVSSVEFELNPAPGGSDPLTPSLDGASYGVQIPQMDATFNVSFDDQVATGFQVVQVTLQGHTDAFCNQFTGTMTVVIPSTSATAKLGNGTVASVMGPYDTMYGGSVLNAWTMMLAGTAQNVNMRIP